MITTYELVIRLLLAALLGSAVGFERERLDWAAGLRTHMLVCVGSALVVIVSAFGFKDILGTPSVVLDPSRIAAQVVSGIGFLGAGTIMFLRREIVRGLTTAAGLWAVAAIGLAIGSGLYVAGVVTTAIVLFILAGLKPLERRLFRNRKIRQLNIWVKRDQFNAKDMESIFARLTLDYVSMTILPNRSDNEDLIEVKLAAGANPQKIMSVLNELRLCAGVREATSGEI